MPKQFPKALGYSLILHGVVVAIFWHSYLAEPLVVPLADSKPIAAFIYQAPVSTERAQAPAIMPPEPSLKSTETMTSVSTTPVPTTSVPTTSGSQARATKPQSKPSRVKTQPEGTATAKRIDNSGSAQPQVMNNSPKLTPSTMSLAERSIALATRQQHQVSREMLAASQVSPAMRELSQRRSAKTTPSNVADNVLDVLADGSFIEKIGDYCYLAKAGADLRADIFSMKPVSCGQNKNDAMFERIMSEVGGGR